MKKDIHPQYYDNAVVKCACGNTWLTGSTQRELRTELCSACHPFFTGEQRIVDTAGQVERYMRRLEQFEEKRQIVEARMAKEEAERKRREAAIAAAAEAERARQSAVAQAEDLTEIEE
ncbi:MAG: 50S ribosomal protein L31 [Chloroflexi bacterium]|nr:50S ribosomal protein L31 [Chloroflexota bacterium]MBU1748001.1 50S ribosomal protein L31 [Chloroflexota bacterium]MBU1877501.1 50S ribosomal protein L31 [Chloroflexota bacterium]